MQRIYCEICKKEITKDYYNFEIKVDNNRVYHGSNQSDLSNWYGGDFCKEHYNKLISEFYDVMREHNIEV